MKLQLYDTMSREVKPLYPEDGKIFRFYCCGPTVYGPAHIGNFRTFLLQDVLCRILKTAGTPVEFVRNITDVDDKTIRQSQQEGSSLETFTQKWTDKFHQDCESLHMLKPDTEPKATDHIQEQIDMIQKLIEKEHAYVSADGSVYFRVESYEDYGQLARLKKDELQTQTTNSANTANLADEYERDTVADFALWKTYKEEDGPNAWDSPWGKGRPGWHIECSAMSIKYLGDHFDLHGGGVDLTFPHHENEIAQSCCCTGQSTFARHWFHCTHLMVEGAKMSKSLGNLYTLNDLIDKGYTATAVRYALISGHYRQQLNFTLNGLNAAQSALNKIEKEVKRLIEAKNFTREDFESYLKPPQEDFFATANAPFRTCWEKLINDLNIPSCLGELFSQMPFDATNITDSKSFLTGLGSLLYALGINPLSAEIENEAIEIPEDVKQLADARWEAKAAKEWAKADVLRGEITTKGWTVKDNKDGYELIKG